MRVYSEDKIKQLKNLRRTGHSIHEIMGKLDMPKTTVWHHIQKIEVLPLYKASLKSKRGGSSKRKERNIQKAKEKAKELLEGKHYNSLVALAMLYWAEGTKKSPAFINSDGRMISLYLKILREVIDVPNESLRITVRIFTGMNRKESLRYWSKITKISSEHFTVRLNDGGTCGRTKYGLCRIEIRKGGQFLKLVNALIDQVFERIMV